MTSREIAKLKVDKFNRSIPVDTKVTYFKSDIEGVQVTIVASPGYVQGDDTAVVVLHGIGIALIDKVEKFYS